MTVNIHVPCIFHVYCDAVRYGNVPGVGILHYQQVLCLECFDSSEVTTRKGNKNALSSVESLVFVDTISSKEANRARAFVFRGGLRI